MSFLGRLSLDAIPADPIVQLTMVAMALGGIVLFGAITYFRKWGYLWNEWFTSVDHKRLGIMYVIVSLVMLVRGFADAFMMRLQLSLAANGGPGYLPPEHYDQIFTAHGVILILFVAMGLVVGLMNVIVPLQIGALSAAHRQPQPLPARWPTKGAGARAIAGGRRRRDFLANARRDGCATGR